MNALDPTYRWDFFLAHAGADSATALVLYDALNTEAKVFLDDKCMLPGDPWTRILPAVLRETRITVVLVSAHTRDAWYEDSEIRIALDLLRDYPGRYRVIALLLDEAEPIRRSALPYGLEQTVTLSWSKCGGVQQVARRLVDTLRADDGKRLQHTVDGAPRMLALTDSVSAFVGPTERGPSWPLLITSWDDFTRSFGQPLPCDRTYLPLAVRGFFENGGDLAYVARVLAYGAATAFLRIATDDQHQDLVLTARNAGRYGNRIQVSVERGSRTGVRVKIRQTPDAGHERTGSDVQRDATLVAEDYDNVSPNPSGPNPLLRVINRSELVSAEWGEPGRPGAMPQSGTWTLSGGADGQVSVRDYIGDASVPKSDQNALASLTHLEDIGILCVPDAVHPRFTPAEQDELTAAIVTHCERERRFAILATAGHDDRRDLPAALPDTSAAAMYFPWVTVPGLETSSPMRVPPVGHVAGAYARHDRQHGVHVSPRGIQLTGLLSGPSERNFHCSANAETIDELVRRGFNILCREAESPAQLALGSAVTMAVEESWRPVGVRRFLNFVERSIIAGTAWATLSPNNEATWKQLREELEAFLLDLWRAGVLKGSRPEEAFYVRCDPARISDDDIATGRVNCEIGVNLADSKLIFPLPPSIHTRQHQSEPPQC